MEFTNILDMQRGIEASTALVRAYAGSDVSKAVCVMLEEVISSYKMELMNVTPDGLVRLQSLVQQAEAIRAVVSGDRQHGTAQL
jgi:hypothetical protein